MNFIPLLFYCSAFFLLLMYGSIMSIAVKGFINALRQEHIKSSLTNRIDVIIVFCNEAENLPNLVAGLNRQTYKNFRVIWINDHSKDRSEHVLNSAKQHYEHITLSADEQGKKAAVKKGLKHVEAPLIAFTDADCSVPATWLSSYAAMADRHKTGLFFGPVQYNTQNWLQKLFDLELLSLVGSGLGLAQQNHPVYMNGANYAITADLLKAYDLQAGQTFASGDDVFLLHAVKNHFGKTCIKPAISKNITVETAAPKNLRQFFRQRIRWGSKASGYKDTEALILAMSVFGIAFIQVLSFLMIKYIAAFLILWIGKILIDMIALLIYKRQKKEHLSMLFFPLAILYPVYVIITAIAGFFISKKRW